RLDGVGDRRTTRSVGVAEGPDCRRYLGRQHVSRTPDLVFRDVWRDPRQLPVLVAMAAEAYAFSTDSMHVVPGHESVGMVARTCRRAKNRRQLGDKVLHRGIQGPLADGLEHAFARPWITKVQ